MSRQNPLRFAFRLALEVALVVAIVSVLPRVDLSGRKTGATEPASESTAAARTIAATQADVDRSSVPSAPQPADAKSRLTPIAALPAASRAWTQVSDTLARGTGASNPAAGEPSPNGGPPRLLNVENDRHGASFSAGPELAPPTGTKPAATESDHGESHYAEQRLDRASQTLLNGLGSYVARAAGELLKAPEPQSSVQPAASFESPTRPAAASSPIVPPAADRRPYIVRSQSAPASQPTVTLPPAPAAPSYTAPSYTAPSYAVPSHSVPSYSQPTYSAPASREVAPAAASAPQINFPPPTSTPQGWSGSFPTEPPLPASRPAPASNFRQWRNY